MLCQGSASVPPFAPLLWTVASVLSRPLPKGAPVGPAVSVPVTLFTHTSNRLNMAKGSFLAGKCQHWSFWKGQLQENRLEIFLSVGSVLVLFLFIYFIFTLQIDQGPRKETRASPKKNI